MQKIIPPRFLNKAKSVLGKFASGRGFGKIQLDNLELILNEPNRLFKSKLSKFRFDKTGRKIYHTERILKKKTLKLNEKEQDLYS